MDHYFKLIRWCTALGDHLFGSLGVFGPKPGHPCFGRFVGALPPFGLSASQFAKVGSMGSFSFGSPSSRILFTYSRVVKLLTGFSCSQNFLSIFRVRPKSLEGFTLFGSRFGRCREPAARCSSTWTAVAVFVAVGANTN